MRDVAHIRFLAGRLAPALRRRWIALVPLAAAAAALEALQAAGVLWFTTLLAEPGRLAAPALARWLPAPLAEAGDTARLQALLAAMAALYVAKNLLLVAAAIARNRVSREANVALSTRLLRSYLDAPYAEHLGRGSAELARNVLHSVPAACAALAAAAAFATNVLIAAGIVAVLIVASPGVTLVVALVLIAVLGAVVAGTRRLFGRWGREGARVQETVFRTLREALDGIKEVKILGREEHMLGAFADGQARGFRLQYLNDTYLVVPRLLAETAFVCAGLLAVALLVAVDHGRDVLPLLALYAYAAFRLLPLTNSILWELNDLRYRTALIEHLVPDFERASRPPPAAAGAGASASASAPIRTLALDAVEFAYPGAERRVIDAVTVRAVAGETLGIVGPTGAGKSTLADLMTGLLEPRAGTVRVDGAAIADRLRAGGARFGYVPQATFLLDDSVRRNVALGEAHDEIDDGRLGAALGAAQLAGWVRGLERGDATVVGENGVRVSGGERQRIAIARALYREPEVLVLDEATSSLDPDTEARLLDALGRLGHLRIRIVISHRLRTMRRCDRATSSTAGG